MNEDAYVGENHRLYKGFRLQLVDQLVQLIEVDPRFETE
jgi:hypothetical protein